MFNIRFATDHLLYRLKAKTRHGLHSPFVYRLVDEVIYDPNAKKVYPQVITRTGLLKRSKVSQVIFRLAADLQPANIIAWGATSGATASYLQQASPLAKIFFLGDDEVKAPNTLDLVLIDDIDAVTVLKHFELSLPKVHQTTLMILGDIYRNEEVKGAWAQIKAHPQVTVTIDLFRLGLVFFRKGQVKEDFTILL